MEESEVHGCDAVRVREEALARAAKTGDREARNALYLQLLPLIMSKGQFAARVLARDGGGALLAEDLEQQAFLIFCDLLDVWEPERAPFVPYLKRKIAWRLLHFVRRSLHYRSRVRFVALPSDRESLELAAGPASEGDTGEARVERAAGWKERTEHLETRWRETLRQHFIEELSSRQIADLKGASARTANRELRAALKAARARAEDEMDGCGTISG